MQNNENIKKWVFKIKRKINLRGGEILINSDVMRRNKEK